MNELHKLLEEVNGANAEVWKARRELEARRLDLHVAERRAVEGVFRAGRYDLLKLDHVAIRKELRKA